MLEIKPLNRLLFIDIETTTQHQNFSDLTEHQQYLFKKRFAKDFAQEVDRKLIIYKIIENLHLLLLWNGNVGM